MAREREERAAGQRAALEARLRALALFLRSEGGRDLVAYLSERYRDGPLVGPTVEKTYMNLGRRDVVEHLREIQEFRNGEGAGA